MLTFREAVMEAARIQAQSGSRLLDLECTSPAENIVLAYLLFDAEWHVLGFTPPHPYDRDQCEQVFLEALAFDAGRANVH